MAVGCSSRIPARCSRFLVTAACIAAPVVRYASESLCDEALDLVDLRFVAPVERPFLHPLAADEAGLHEDPEVFAEAGLGDLQLRGDQDAADTVVDEIAIDLRRKVPPRLLEPLENLEAPGVGQGSKCAVEIHIDT